MSASCFDLAMPGGEGLAVQGSSIPQVVGPAVSEFWDPVSPPPTTHNNTHKPHKAVYLGRISGTY